MTASVVPELLAAFLATIVVIGAATAWGALWLRRRWRRFRSLVTGQVGDLLEDAGAAGWAWLWGRPLPDRRWWAIHRVRRQVSRGLGAAEHAVATARAAGVPRGDLESLCRRLRRAATDIDRSLAVAQRATGPRPDTDAVMSQAEDVVASAHCIQRAAAMALAEASGESTQQLREDAHREIVALASGIESAGGPGALSSRQPLSAR